MRAILLVHRWPPSYCVLTRWRERNRTLPLHIRPPILLHEDPILIIAFNLNYLLKTLTPNTVTLEVRASTYEFRGNAILSARVALSLGELLDHLSPVPTRNR